MSDQPPDGPFGQFPFGPGGFDLSEIFRMLQSPGPVNWELAREIAQNLAAGDPETGEPRDDPAVDAQRADSLIALVRAAQTHVAGATGLAEAAAVPVQVVTRREWTTITLDGLRPVLEALATTMAKPFGAPGGGLDQPAANPFSAGADAPDLLAGVMGALTPMLFGVQAGSLAGLLSQHALGQFDLPLPLGGEPRLAFVQSNIDAFTNDWSLAPNDLMFALALREVVHAAQRSVRWVRQRLVRLCTDYVTKYELNPDVLMERMPFLDQLEDFDPMEALQQGELPQMPAIDVDPEALLAGMRTPAQEPVLAELARFGAVLGGYADAVLDALESSLLPDAARIEEALRRHRVERGQAAEFVDSMLGLEIDREQYERGHAFCGGVIERAGLVGLNRLWEREAHVPTEAELDAPGLWIARVELDLPD